MRAHGYALTADPDCVTIAYVEGCDAPSADAPAKPNANRPNAYVASTNANGEGRGK